MATEKNITQKDINAVWVSEWKDHVVTPDVFKQRLFVEGFSAYRRYFPESPRRVLDIGGGTGRYGIAIAREFSDAEVVVTDIVEESLVLGKKIAEKVGVTNVRFEKADALRLPYTEGVFDLVFCDVVIQHIPDNQRVFDEFARVLAPGGLLIASGNNFWNIPHQAYKKTLQLLRRYSYGYERAYTHSDLRGLAESVGLSVVALDGFYFAYGVYRWKSHWRGWALVGKVLNRITKVLDRMSRRIVSRYFGFEIFVVARKPLS